MTPAHDPNLRGHRLVADLDSLAGRVPETEHPFVELDRGLQVVGVDAESEVVHLVHGGG